MQGGQVRPIDNDSASQVNDAASALWMRGVHEIVRGQWVELGNPLEERLSSAFSVGLLS